MQDPLDTAHDLGSVIYDPQVCLCVRMGGWVIGLITWACGKYVCVRACVMYRSVHVCSASGSALCRTRSTRHTTSAPSYTTLGCVSVCLFVCRFCACVCGGGGAGERMWVYVFVSRFTRGFMWERLRVAYVNEQHTRTHAHSLAHSLTQVHPHT